jgi:hypothetical protein
MTHLRYGDKTRCGLGLGNGLRVVSRFPAMSWEHRLCQACLRHLNRSSIIRAGNGR